MLLRVRAPMSLVAALVAIALVVGALIGGRLVQDWSVVHRPVPAGGPSKAEQISLLEARQWQQPLLPAGAACPDGPKDSLGEYGIGPFRGAPDLGTGSTTTSWGIYYLLVGASDKDTTGLMLIRARDMRTGASLVFVGQYAFGPTLGTDAVYGKLSQQHAEVLLDLSHPPTGSGTRGANGQTYWAFTAGAAKAWPQCAQWQIDGQGYTETFSFLFTS